MASGLIETSFSRVGETEGESPPPDTPADDVAQPKISVRFLSGVVELVEASTQPDRSKALALIEAGIEQSDGGWLTPEWLRLTGELLLLQSSLGVTETAENLFGKALDEARRQEACLGTARRHEPRPDPPPQKWYPELCFLLTGGPRCQGRAGYKPEEIIAKLRQVDESGRRLGDPLDRRSEVTYYRWRQEFGGLKSDQINPEGIGDREHQAAPRRIGPDFGQADPAGGGPGKLLLYSGLVDLLLLSEIG